MPVQSLNDALGGFQSLSWPDLIHPSTLQAIGLGLLAVLYFGSVIFSHQEIDSLASENVVKFYGKDAASKSDNVLEKALGCYDEVLVIGIGKDGELDVRATLGLKDEASLWLIEKFKHKLLSGDYSEDV